MNADHKQIENGVVSGNKTTTHLLLGIAAKYIRREPYIPTVSEFPIIKTGEIGIKAAPFVRVFIMPGPAGYVGGDIVSGILYSELNQREDITLFKPDYSTVENNSPRGICRPGMDFSAIHQMIITGGFGQFLDIEKAITIGLLPDIERKKFKYMGSRLYHPPGADQKIRPKRI